MSARQRIHRQRNAFKATCQRAKRCEAGCGKGEPCARLPQRLRIEADAYRERQLDLFKPDCLPEGFVVFALEPTGGVIPVREVDGRPGVYDFTPAGLAHLTAAQLELYREWDAHHEYWELRYSGVIGRLGPKAFDVWPFADVRTVRTATPATTEDTADPKPATPELCEVAA